MAVRPTERKQGILAVYAASLVLAAWFAGPAYGAAAHDTRCNQTHDATLEVSESELTATLINHEIEDQDAADKVDVQSADQLLRPRAAATIREVFGDSDDEAEQSEAAETESDDAVIMNTRVPGFSDDELARFKRQMYRKDI